MHGAVLLAHPVYVHALNACLVQNISWIWTNFTQRVTQYYGFRRFHLSVANYPERPQDLYCKRDIPWQRLDTFKKISGFVSKSVSRHQNIKNRFYFYFLDEIEKVVRGPTVCL